MFLTNFLKKLFYENGSPSLSKVLVALYFLLFSVVSVYLAFMNQQWAHYEMFATISGGAGIAGQISHKFINSKYNTVAGSYESAQAPAPRGQ